MIGDPEEYGHRLIEAVRRDCPSVTREGAVLGEGIDGLDFRFIHCHGDQRGEVAELFRTDWGWQEAPVQNVTMVMLWPGVVKGWHLHERGEDRNAVVAGFTRWAFYDDRLRSQSRGRLVVRTFSERARSIIHIPRGVWHAVQNVGRSDAILVNLPTTAYDYERPDKLRLPLKNELIPFDFSDLHG
jgi:dTDP-4-dehydrorhamnose 3,5-epimerase